MYFEIAHRMIAYGTSLGRRRRYDYMTAIPAFPHLDFALFENLLGLYVLK